jgi:hypothetical protein
MSATAATTAMAAFACPGDGHFGDDIDCTIFYHCANGIAMEGSCPGGLFFNRGKRFLLTQHNVLDS